MTHSRIQLTLLSVFSIFKAKKAIFKEESTLSMGPRLSKNILEIQQIESGTLAKFWSDGRNVAKVIANLVQPFCQKQALHVVENVCACILAGCLLCDKIFEL